MDKNKTLEYTEVSKKTIATEKVERRPSPFAYRKGMTIKFESYRMNRLEKMTSLLEKGLIGADDKRIMEHFSKYVFLNAHLLYLLLAAEKGEDTKEEYARNRLTELFRLGLLTRFRLVYRDTKEHSSSYVYAISERAAKSYNAKPAVFEPVNVIRRLAFNQYYISMKKYPLYTHTYQFSENETCADSLLSLMSNKKVLSFNVITVRSNDGCLKEYADKLLAFHADKNAAFIVLCESELFALDLETFRQSNPPISEATVLYMCDYSTFDAELLLGNLILVNNASQGSYTTVSLKVD